MFKKVHSGKCITFFKGQGDSFDVTGSDFMQINNADGSLIAKLTGDGGDSLRKGVTSTGQNVLITFKTYNSFDVIYLNFIIF